MKQILLFALMILMSLIGSAQSCFEKEMTPRIAFFTNDYYGIYGDICQTNVMLYENKPNNIVIACKEPMTVNVEVKFFDDEIKTFLYLHKVEINEKDKIIVIYRWDIINDEIVSRPMTLDARCVMVFVNL